MGGNSEGEMESEGGGEEGGLGGMRRGRGRRG